MHAVHTTPGFIIDSRPYGEAGRVLSMFTRDFGLVTATAQGIRLEKSKLRYHVQEYSLGTFSLVRGQEYWRLTSAQGGEYEINRESLEMVSRVALILRRLVQGEDPNEALFESVSALFSYVSASKPTSDKILKPLESLTVIRILNALGYVGNEKNLSEFVASDDFTPDLITAAGKNLALVNKTINSALRESHL